MFSHMYTKYISHRLTIFYLSNIKRDAFSKAIKSSKGFKAGAMAGRKKATDFK